MLLALVHWFPQLLIPFNNSTYTYLTCWLAIVCGPTLQSPSKHIARQFKMLFGNTTPQQRRWIHPALCLTGPRPHTTTSLRTSGICMTPTMTFVLSHGQTQSSKQQWSRQCTSSMQRRKSTTATSKYNACSPTYLMRTPTSTQMYKGCSRREVQLQVQLRICNLQASSKCIQSLSHFQHLWLGGL